MAAEELFVVTVPCKDVIVDDKDELFDVMLLCNASIFTAADELFVVIVPFIEVIEDTIDPDVL